MFTVQTCTKCGQDVEIEALDFLLNLDRPIVCDKCKQKGG